MTGVGPGVCELRIRAPAGAFRVIYVATFRDAIYVLHAFHKKSQRTRRADLDLAKRRYTIARELAEEPDDGQKSH